jgi:hypothetical protein
MVVGDIAKTQFKTGQFQTVYYENVPFKDPYARTRGIGAEISSLDEAYRVLKPGGTLKIQTGALAPINEIQAKIKELGLERMRVERLGPPPEAGEIDRRTIVITASEEGDAMKRVFAMCQSNHLFEGRVCPYDGSENAFSDEIANALRSIHARGEAIDLAALRAAGVSSEALEWVVVAEFGSESVAFEGIEIASFVVNGKRREQLGE